MNILNVWDGRLSKYKSNSISDLSFLISLILMGLLYYSLLLNFPLESIQFDPLRRPYLLGLRAIESIPANSKHTMHRETDRRIDREFMWRCTVQKYQQHNDIKEKQKRKWTILLTWHGVLVVCRWDIHFVLDYCCRHCRHQYHLHHLDFRHHRNSYSHRCLLKPNGKLLRFYRYRLLVSSSFGCCCCRCFLMQFMRNLK